MKEFIDKLISRLLLESSGCRVYKLINPNIEDITEFNAYKKCIEIVNELAEEYKGGCDKPKTNFDYCCESVENMAQIIDIAKIGRTKEQIIERLQSEAE